MTFHRLWTGHRYAIKHSGLHRIKHRHNSVITLMVYALMGIVTLIFLSYTIMILRHKENWLMSATVQDPYDPDISNVIKARNKSRGTAASLLSLFSFSLIINGSLDKAQPTAGLSNPRGSLARACLPLMNCDRTRGRTRVCSNQRASLAQSPEAEN